MKASDLDKKFDEGEDITKYLVELNRSAVVRPIKSQIPIS